MRDSAEHALAVYRQADCLYTWEQVESAVDRLAKAVTTAVGGEAPVVLAVMTGAVIPVAELLQRLDFPLELDYVHATRYGDATRGGELEWIARPRTGLEGRTVLVVDDILDEGDTLAAIVADCREQGAQAVYSAVMVEKRHERRRPGVEADFVGLEVEDRYVFGCGMDYKGYLRNVPGIFAVKEEA